MKRLFPLTAVCMATALAADIPIREVILYKSGVGYFERAGTLGPGESARLDFKAIRHERRSEIAHACEDRNGGKVTGLRYDSMDPLGHKLAEFPFQIGAAQPLSVMLDQLKGARLELKFGNETVAGAIVNGRLVVASDKQPEREQLTLMLDGGELRTLDLSAATSIHFTDPQLQQQFHDYLAALAAIALQGKTQRVHRFHRRQGARGGGQLHDPGAGVEVELSPDFRRQRAAGAGGLGHCGQHHRRGLDQGAAFPRLGPADFVRQPTL
jgi:hypothetical protein